MKPVAYVLTSLIAHVPLLAYSADADVDTCRRIDSDMQRLACYDEIFERSSIAEPQESFGDPQEAVAPEVATTVEQDTTAAATFGAEQVRQPPLEYVEARLVGDFTGWTGKTVFRLDNGQVWQQTSNYIRNYTPRNPIPQARVTISKGGFGGYNMRIEGVKRIVQVKRVK